MGVVNQLDCGNHLTMYTFITSSCLCQFCLNKAMGVGGFGATKNSENNISWPLKPLGPGFPAGPLHACAGPTPEGLLQTKKTQRASNKKSIWFTHLPSSFIFQRRLISSFPHFRLLLETKTKAKTKTKGTHPPPSGGFFLESLKERDVRALRMIGGAAVWNSHCYPRITSQKQSIIKSGGAPEWQHAPWYLLMRCPPNQEAAGEKAQQSPQ